MTTSGSGQPPLYEDRWITCTPRPLTIRDYYFPLGGSLRTVIGEAL